MNAPTKQFSKPGQSYVQDGILLPLHVYQGKYLQRAMFGLVLATAFFFATLAHAAPVTVNVNVTGADGKPAPNASVTVTQATSNPNDPTAPSGSANTGANGSASVNSGRVLPQNQTQSLEPGVYRVDVVAGGKLTTTYVHVADGQTGTVNVDLRTAKTTNPRGENHADAAENAESSQQRGDRNGYDRAVGRIDEIIEHRTKAVEDLEEAVEDFAETHDIRPDNLRDATDMRKRIGRLHAKRPDLVDQSKLDALDEYIGLLKLLEIWRSALGIIQNARNDVPSFSALPSQDNDGDTQNAGLDRAAENLASNISGNQGRSIPRVTNPSVGQYNFHYKF